MINDSDMLLAKTSLPSGWIDMGIGESDVVYSEIKKYINPIQKVIHNNMHYMSPKGYSPFIEVLESTYSKPCISTVGAKQGLMASFLTLKRLGISKIVTTYPYWTSLPSIISTCGMEFSTYFTYDKIIELLINDEISPKNTAVLIVSPNNPDSAVTSPYFFKKLKELGCYIIHDAAYENEFYGFNLTSYDVDIKLMSAAKQFGMSATRTGWMIVNNEELLPIAEDVVETLSSSSGMLDQVAVLDVIEMLKDKSIYNRVVLSVTNEIHSRKFNFLSNLSNDYFPQETINNAMFYQKGIFIWLKKSKQNLDNIKVRFIDGKNFGAPEYIRLCVGNVTTQECLDASKRFVLT